MIDGGYTEEQLAELFGIKKEELVKTTGINTGFIIKFHSHYIKLYDSKKEGCYDIYLYDNYHSEYISYDIVHYTNLKQWIGMHRSIIKGY